MAITRWWYDENGEVQTALDGTPGIPGRAAYDMTDRPEWGDPLFAEFWGDDEDEDDLEDWDIEIEWLEEDEYEDVA